MSIITEHPINYTLSKAEKIMNIPGYILIVSSYSGPIRFKAGLIEVIVALSLALFKFLQGNLEKDPEKRVQKFLEARTFLPYALHGAANMGRGTVETIPLLGNILCINYDVLKFRFKYEHEKAETPFVHTVIKHYLMNDSRKVCA